MEICVNEKDVERDGSYLRIKVSDELIRKLSGMVELSSLKPGQMQMAAALAYDVIDLEDILKPCRLCGEKPKLLKTFTKYKAKCKVCGCSATAETKIDLVSLWNGGL